MTAGDAHLVISLGAEQVAEGGATGISLV